MTSPLLSRFALLELQGEDAAGFLHGQLCGDVQGTAPGASLFTAWCSPKGRVLATLLVAPRPEGCLVLLPRELKETVLKRLRLYVLRARVEIRDREDLAVAGWLDGGAGLPSGLQFEAPWQTGAADGLIGFSVPGAAGPRLLLAGPGERLGALPGSADEAAWDRADIEAALPWIGPATADEFLPQELGLETLGGLSYRKGCYPGQEVIARVHYRGRAKRALHRFTTAAPVAPATRLVDGEGRAAGWVIAAVADADTWMGLAALEPEAGPLRAGDTGGPAIALVPG